MFSIQVYIGFELIESGIVRGVYINSVARAKRNGAIEVGNGGGDRSDRPLKSTSTILTENPYKNTATTNPKVTLFFINNTPKLTLRIRTLSSPSIKLLSGCDDMSKYLHLIDSRFGHAVSGEHLER